MHVSPINLNITNPRIRTASQIEGPNGASLQRNQRRRTDAGPSGLTYAAAIPAPHTINIVLTDPEKQKLKNNWKISIAATVIQQLLPQPQMTREQIIFFISKSNQESINPPQDKLTNIINVINTLTARDYTTKEISRMGAQNALA